MFNKFVHVIRMHIYVYSRKFANHSKIKSYSSEIEKKTQKTVTFFLNPKFVE